MKPLALDMAGTARAAWLARIQEEGGDSSRVPPARFAGPPALPDAAREKLPDAHALWQLAHELSLLKPAGADRDFLRVLGMGMLVIAQQGSTTLPLTKEVLGEDGAFAAILRQVDPEVSKNVLAALRKGKVPTGLKDVISAGSAAPLLLEEGHLSLQRFSRLEQRLASALAAQLAQAQLPAAAVKGARAAFEEVGADLGDMKWAVDQQRALLNAVHLPFTVISGGPGTGKTTIVVSLLRILARLGVAPGRVALAAPTGKAANRMFEEVKRQLRGKEHPADAALRDIPEARTLHRLLGYSPGRDRFGLDEVNPIDADLVVVDESSMVDLFLMERLLRAFAPEKGKVKRLVLLGDANQLPSVEAGMVLHHLAEPTPPLGRPWFTWVLPGGKRSQTEPVKSSGSPAARYLVTLTYSHRMDPERQAGKAIYEYAESIRKGEAEAFTGSGERVLKAKEKPSELAFTHVEHLAFDWSARAQPQAFYERWWRERWCRPGLAELRKRAFQFKGGKMEAAEAAALRQLLAAAESQRILCLTRGTGLEGAERTNDWFSARMKKEEEAGLGGFRAGEPVIFTVNDYGLRLFNGYSGVVAWTSVDGGKPRLRAIFEQPSGLEAYELEALKGRLEHAYALTVHKAQGSQFECVALLLPHEAESPLLVKQLVYTAVSRASDSVVVVGDLQRLVQAVKSPVTRYSAVMERAARMETA